MTGAVAVLSGSVRSSAQATVDADNSYPNVGAIMVWRVDDSGKPVEFRGFASGTLIRTQVMITAGHFTAPVCSSRWRPPSYLACRLLRRRLNGVDEHPDFSAHQVA
jgi:hypothetical protein